MRHFVTPAGRRFLIGQSGVLLIALVSAMASTLVAVGGSAESSTLTSEGIDAVVAGVLPSAIAVMQVIAVWPPQVSGFEHRLDPWAAFMMVHVRHVFVLAVLVLACAGVSGVARLVADLAASNGGFSAGIDGVVGDGAVTLDGAGPLADGLGLLVLRNVVIGMIIGSAALGTGRPGATALVAFPALGVLAGVPSAVVDWYLRPTGFFEVACVIAAQVVFLLVVAAYRMVYRR